ncbi:MAG TPA: peptidoglycan-binding domain-containing protein [Hyphomicrobiaceae bacterium]|nr:peptidoglycan-binding domain-containing protein [Hyphomicrobiaceae bacterium]
MTPRRARVYASVFVVFVGSVAANVLLLQPRALPHGEQSSSGAPTRLAAAASAKAPAGPDREASPATIRAIQRELKAAGYYEGPSDGLANLSTHAAIMAYESDQQLELTGLPSDALLKMLILGTGRARVAGENRSAAVRGTPAEQLTRLVQQQLIAHGYSISAVDGRLGDDTRRAIAAFEADQRLKPSGRISAPLLAKLQGSAPTGRVASGR